MDEISFAIPESDFRQVVEILQKGIDPKVTFKKDQPLEMAEEAIDILKLAISKAIVILTNGREI